MLFYFGIYYNIIMYNFKIDTQFCRLYESESDLNNLLHDETKADFKLLKNIKLSCISDEYSKTSIKCFKDTLNKNGKSKNLKSIIMYECAIEEISIKGIKNLKSIENEEKADENKEPENSSSSNESNKLSIFEFDISKIWFSFPEPPTSPKGKRKIPYSRFDWNLLSSVSPAVTSWLCALKHTTKPLKDCIVNRNKLITQILAALIVGSLKNKEHLDRKIEFLLKNDQVTAYKNDSNLGARLKNKITSKSNVYSGSSSDEESILVAKLSHFRNYIQMYMTSYSLALYSDPNCRLVNILRNYLLLFEDDFKYDLFCPTIPENEYLKRGINEVLNSWSSLIVSTIVKGINVKTENSRSKMDHLDKYNDNRNVDTVNAGQKNENFKFITEIRENKPLIEKEKSVLFQQQAENLGSPTGNT